MISFQTNLVSASASANARRPSGFRTAQRGVLLCAGLLSACSWWRVDSVSAPELPPVSVVEPIQLPEVSHAQLLTRFDHLKQLVQQTRSLQPDWRGADRLLEQISAAIDTSQWDKALRLIEEADAQARIAISDYYARQANVELARAYNFIGLSDAQLLQLRHVEEMMVTGNSKRAFGQLRVINAEIEQRVEPYQVRAGDSLWLISSRPEAYANPFLWPLIWQANISIIPNPDRLRRGQILDIKPHPTASDVAEAIARAKGQSPRKTLTPTIGPIRRGRQ